MSKRKSSLPDARVHIGKQRLDDITVDECSAGSDAVELQDLLPEDSINEDVEDQSFRSLDSGMAGMDDGFDDDLLLQSLVDQPLETGAECAAPESSAELEEEAELPIGEDKLSTADEIDLRSLSISIAQARRIAPLLSANDALTVIHFDGHDLSVTELKEEDELEWDSEEFTDVEAIIIAEFLRTNTCVNRLDLARNLIADAGAEALAHALSSNSTLEYLNLESNSVAEKGGAALIQAVQTNGTLQYLNLAFNSLSSACQQELRDVWTLERQGLAGLHL